MGDDKNQLVSSGQNNIILPCMKLLMLKMLMLCTIFLKLTTYTYVHNYSINTDLYNIYKLKYISWFYK